jgi:hypothetical protein
MAQSAVVNLSDYRENIEEEISTKANIHEPTDIPKPLFEYFTRQMKGMQNNIGEMLLSLSHVYGKKTDDMTAQISIEVTPEITEEQHALALESIRRLSSIRSDESTDFRIEPED